MCVCVCVCVCVHVCLFMYPSHVYIHHSHNNPHTVIFDLNGTALYRKWLGHKEGYGRCTMRPHFKDLIEGISMETRTLVAVWTGATSIKKMDVLLKHLYDAGIKKNMFLFSIGAMPYCNSKKFFPGDNMQTHIITST